MKKETITQLLSFLAVGLIFITPIVTKKPPIIFLIFAYLILVYLLIFDEIFKSYKLNDKIIWTGLIIMLSSKFFRGEDILYNTIDILGMLILIGAFIMRLKRNNYQL